MVISGKYQVKNAPTSARIGSNTGKSLAEQLPKAIEQGRLAAGLQDFSKNASSMNPLQAATNLLSIPGIGAEHIYALQPLLKQMQDRNAALGQGTLEGEASQNRTLEERTNSKEPQLSNAQNKTPERNPSRTQTPFDQLHEAATGRKIQTPETVQAQLTEVREPTQNEIFNKRNDYLRKQPWLSPEAATDMANDYYRRENAKILSKMQLGEREIAIEKQIEDEFNKYLGRDLQKSGENIYADITGRFQNELLDKAFDEVSRGGSTPKQAVHKWAEIAGNYARMKKKIETDSKKEFYLQNPKAVMDNISQGAKYALQLNRGREYADDLVANFNISKPFAKDRTFPPTKSPQDYLKTIENPYHGANLSKIQQSASQGFNRSQKYAHDIAPMITDKDSIESIAYNIKKKDPFFDERAFYDVLKDMEEDGSFRTNPLQREELSSRESNLLGNLKDMWFQALGGR